MKTKFYYLFALISVGYLFLISCKKESDSADTTPIPTPTPTELFREGAGVTDVNGNTYRTVIINVSSAKSATAVEQEWMAENLKATSYASGTTIDPSLMTVCNGDSSTVNNFGYLYTWEAAMNNSIVLGSQGACPNGWHVPTVEEYNTLMTKLGGGLAAGEKMTAPDTAYWNAEAIAAATNAGGFNARGGGWKSSGMYFHFKNVAEFWTSVEAGTSARLVQVSGRGANNAYSGDKSMYNSCRCIKN